MKRWYLSFRRNGLPFAGMFVVAPSRASAFFTAVTQYAAPAAEGVECICVALVDGKPPYGSAWFNRILSPGEVLRLTAEENGGGLLQ